MSTSSDIAPDRMIFLTTPMRSGSSYLSRILSAHPALSMSYDSVNFFRFAHQKYGVLSVGDNAKRLVQDMSFRLQHRFGIRLPVEECLAALRNGEATYARAYWSILRSLFPDRTKTILGDKESMAWSKIPDFLHMFPDGRAIIIVRDPRDVVTSFKHVTIAPGDDYLIALFDVVDAINHGVRMQQRDPERVHMVRFEALKLYPEQEVRRLCSFLGIDFLPAMLDPDTYTDHNGSKWRGEESQSFPEEKDPLAAVGRWKRKITPEDLYLCEWIARSQIQMIGGALSGHELNDEGFDRAMAKLTSSPLLRRAFKRWCDTGEGVEQCPLDPTDPRNWDPIWVQNPKAFAASSETR
jgi:hypothetical protein